ncbi:MAG: decaprenyl-phosphate phosphoribosyltransferase [Elusimicrobiota bacterium]|nr:decaprenyl-phosphate phosphoribosyltransferase [Elusimicrobiota bacterium]
MEISPKSKIKSYLKLFRIHHWLKNALVFTPLIFAVKFFNFDLLIKTAFCFLAFSLLASAIYIINDIFDASKDKLHKIKHLRPIASGQISCQNAAFCSIILIALAFIVNFCFVKDQSLAWLFLALYLFSNIAYSLGLKNIPLIDLIILVCGFLLRILYGSQTTGIPISNWLYLVIFASSFFMGLGKRRNEILTSGADTREVLKRYAFDFLDKSLYVCLTLTVVFYAMWAIDVQAMSRHSINPIWTVSLVLIICLRYSMVLENKSFGDPVDILLHDAVLKTLVFLYAIIMFFVLYGQTVI